MECGIPFHHDVGLLLQSLCKIEREGIKASSFNEDYGNYSTTITYLHPTGSFAIK